MHMVSTAVQGPTSGAAAAGIGATAEEERVHARYAVFRRLTPPGGGPRGSCAPWGWWQRAKIAVAAVTLLPVRAVVGLIMLSTFTAIAYVCARVDGALLGAQGDLLAGPMHRRVLSPAARGFTRVFLFVLGLHRIRVSGREHCAPPRAGSADPGEYPAPLIVSNHVSYLDILVHFAVSGYLCPGFLAKDGVRTAPFFGPIGRVIGCQFVARDTNDSLGDAAAETAEKVAAAPPVATGSRGGAGASAGAGVATAGGTMSNTGSTAEMVGRLRWAEGCLAGAARKGAQGRVGIPKPLIVFAEGTTTNGCGMLRFRTGAFVAGCRVQPVVLEYPHTHFSPSFESVSFLPHVLAFLCQFHTPCSVTFLPPRDPDGRTPREFADDVQRKMQPVVGGIVYDLTYNDKRSYHRWLRGGPAPKQA